MHFRPEVLALVQCHAGVPRKGHVATQDHPEELRPGVYLHVFVGGHGMVISHPSPSNIMLTPKA